MPNISVLNRIVNKITTEELKELRVNPKTWLQLCNSLSNLQIQRLSRTLNDRPFLLIRGCTVIPDKRLELTSNGLALSHIWKKLVEANAHIKILKALELYDDDETSKITMATLPFVAIIRVYHAMCYHDPQHWLVEYLRREGDIKEIENGKSPTECYPARTV